MIKSIEKKETVIGIRKDDQEIEMTRGGGPDREVSPRKEDRDINGPEAGPTTGNGIEEILGKTGVVVEALKGRITVIDDEAGMVDEDLHHRFVSSTVVVGGGMIGQGPEAVLMISHPRKEIKGQCFVCNCVKK